MEHHIKIREVSQRYGISARTLRYYEDIGILWSSRTDAHAYRTYDTEGIKRLEQILILRKLNISIKDIQRVFVVGTAQALMEVLEGKVAGIDEDVTLLRELRGILMDFIGQIETSDFNEEADVRRLYARAREIEQVIVRYDGNAAEVNRLLAVTDRLEKDPEVRIVSLPPMDMIQSPCGNPEAPDGPVQVFHDWAMETLFDGDEAPYGGGLPIFSWDDGTGFRFIVKKPKGYVDTQGWESFAFAGGLYAVYAAWLPEIMEKGRQVDRWLAEHALFRAYPLAEAQGRHGMSRIVTPPTLQARLQNEQHDVYIPIALREEVINP